MPARIGSFIGPTGYYQQDLNSVRPLNNSTIPYDNRPPDVVNPPTVQNGGTPVPVPLPYGPEQNAAAALAEQQGGLVGLAAYIAQLQAAQAR